MEPLDARVSQAVYAASLLEKALHNPHGWSIRLGNFDLPVTRVVHENGVRFTTPAYDLCHLHRDPMNVSLCFGGRVVASKTIEVPSDGGMSVRWDVGFSAKHAIA